MSARNSFARCYKFGGQAQRRPPGQTEAGNPGRAEGREQDAMTSKRKLFDELMHGLESMQQQREGKVTLRSAQRETSR